MVLAWQDEEVRKLMLQIDRPIHWARLFAALGAVVQTLTGDEGGWTIGSRQVLEDREWSPSRAFAQVLSRPAARLEIEVASSTTGNPRDGWGYTFRVHLAVHTSIGEVSLMGSAYDGRMMDSGVMPPHSLSLRGPIDGACFDRVRAALAEALGREVSPGGCNAWAHNIEAIKLEDPDRARRWLAESLSMRHSTGERSLKRLLDLSDELRGADPQILRRRLRSTPADIDGWLAARVSRPRGYSAARINTIISRLQPYDPDRTTAPFDQPDPSRWRYLDVDPYSARATNLTRRVVSRLLPELGGVEHQQHDCRTTPSHRLTTRCQARFGRKGLPLIWVLRTAEELEGDTHEQEWIWGSEADECLRVARVWRREGEDRRFGGSWLHFEGGADFRARVNAAVLAVCPHRFRPGRVGERTGTRPAKGSTPDAEWQRRALPPDPEPILRQLLIDMEFPEDSWERLTTGRRLRKFPKAPPNATQTILDSGRFYATKAVRKYNRGYKTWEASARRALYERDRYRARVDGIDWG